MLKGGVRGSEEPQKPGCVNFSMAEQHQGQPEAACAGTQAAAWHRSMHSKLDFYSAMVHWVERKPMYCPKLFGFLCCCDE